MIHIVDVLGGVLRNMQTGAKVSVRDGAEFKNKLMGVMVYF